MAQWGKQNSSSDFLPCQVEESGCQEEVKIHIRKFKYDLEIGWMPIKARFMLDLSEGICALQLPM